MEGRLLLKDCSLFRADGRVRSGMAVLIEGPIITRIEPDADLPVLPGDWAVRCGGRIVSPGLIDSHTRLVGGQLTAWSGDYLLRPFLSRFEAECRVEEHLTVGEVEALTAYGLARALKQGVTMHVEHLHSPHCVEEGLRVQARVAEVIGARMINSHASTSLSEGSPGPDQVDANAAYVVSRKDHPLVRGSLGVHSSFAADDDLMRRIGKLKEELGVGAHFRMAESDDDLAMTWTRHGTRCVARFESFGLLGGGSIGAHARAIDRTEALKLARTRTLIALSPRTAQTVEGGSALGMDAVLLSQNLAGLGTDGASSLWEELAASFTGVMAMSRAGRMLDPDNLMSSFLVSGPAELCTMIFGRPSGTVEQGALADVVLYDFVPPADPGNATPHLLMRLSQLPVAWTIVNGRVVVREGQLVGADVTELARESARAVESARARIGETAG